MNEVPTLPLLLAHEEFAAENETEPLDRLRMQKGVFLLQMAGAEEWRDAYTFIPYDWGPFSRDLAREVTALVDGGQLAREPVPLRTYPRFRTTPEGERALADNLAKLSEKQKDFIRRVRAYVTGRSFAQLLREVYKAYPDFAVNSRFKG